MNKVWKDVWGGEGPYPNEAAIVLLWFWLGRWGLRVVTACRRYWGCWDRFESVRQARLDIFILLKGSSNRTRGCENSRRDQARSTESWFSAGIRSVYSGLGRNHVSIYFALGAQTRSSHLAAICDLSDSQRSTIIVGGTVWVDHWQTTGMEQGIAVVLGQHLHAIIFIGWTMHCCQHSDCISLCRRPVLSESVTR